MVTSVSFPSALRIAEQLHEVFPSYPVMHRAGDLTEAAIKDHASSSFNGAELAAILINCLEQAQEVDDEPASPSPTRLDRALFASIVLQNVIHQRRTLVTSRDEFTKHVTRCVELMS